MKKYLALMLGVLFVLSFAASAFAIHAEIPAESQKVVAASAEKITLGGEIRTRGWYTKNIDSNALSNKTNSAAWYDERIRLNVEATVAPGVVGYVQIETTSAQSGDKSVWGTGQTTPIKSNGVAGSNSKSNASLDILQSWILYTGQGLFGFNSGLKVGHMPLKLGYGQFFDNTQYGDDAVVFFMDPVKGLHIGLLTFKGSEASKAKNTDDFDAYVGLLTYKWDDKNTVGINYTYLNSPALLDGQVLPITYGNVTPPVTTLTVGRTALKMQNLEVHADGTIAGLGYKTAFDVQFGSVLDDTQKTKFRGYAFNAALNYNINPVNLRGSFVYGSGDNDASDDKFKEFLPFVGNIQNYSFIYEYQHATTANSNFFLNNATPSDGHAAGVANTMYFNLGLDYTATKELGFSVDGYIFKASKVGAAEQLSGHSDISKDAGWELDAKMKYALAKNLSYQIDAGYFKEGSYFEDLYHTDKKATTAIRHTLTLSF